MESTLVVRLHLEAVLEGRRFAEDGHCDAARPDGLGAASLGGGSDESGMSSGPYSEALVEAWAQRDPVRQ